MQVKNLTTKSDWEQFVQETSPPTFLHSWNWGEVNQARGQKIWRLGIYNEDKLLAVALIIKVEAKRGHFLFCPHGPIIQDLAQTKAILEQLTQALKNLGAKENCAFFRISPILEDTKKNNEIFSILGYREAPIHMMHPELSWMISLEESEQKIFAGMRKNTRYYIRKAEKEIVLIELSQNPKSITDFWRIYEQTAKRQSFAPFSKKYIETEFSVFHQDKQVAFIFAKYQGEVIAAALIIFYKNQAFYHHGASIRRYKHLATTSYLLQWEAIKEAKRRGCKLYNFWGIAKDTQKNHPWQGITTFKTGFGGFSQSYVHAKDYPLTKKYWLAFIVEKLRTLKRHY